MNITEVLVQPQAIAWLPWAVQYFLYIGSAYAAAILFLIALYFEQQTSHRLRAALVLTLAIGAIVGPLALTGDLHQPGRAWHFYAYSTPWSWMSLGSLFLPLFSGLAILTAWLYLRNDLISLDRHSGRLLPLMAKLSLGQWQISRKYMLIVTSATVISGLSIALYTGAEIAIIQSRPLWHQPASPMIWFITAFIGAVGFSLIIWLLLPKDKQQSALTIGDARLLRQSTAISSVLTLLLIPIWASNNDAFSLYADSLWVKNLIAMVAVLSGCILISLWVLRGSTKASTHFSCSILGITILAVITLAAAWLVRWITMMEVQTIAKFDVGPYPYNLPMDSNGLLGIVGMFGLWLALALLGSELIQPEQKPSSHTTASEH